MPDTQNQQEYKTMTKQKIIVRILRYFFFEGQNFFLKCKKHLELMEVLKPYKKANLITFRTYAIYLFSYISRSLDVDDKLKILSYHYAFLKNIFPSNKLKQVFNEGIELYKESSDDDDFSVILTTSSLLEFEGSLSLFFKVNDTKIFTLSFTFAPGESFNSDDKTVIYISCLQGVKNQFDNISKATKYFQDIIPSVILLKVLESLAVALNIKKILGIPAKDQLSFGNEVDYDNFYQNYDEFWTNVGGKLDKGSYVIPCPVPQKSISLIKQNHRNRTIKKRRKLNEIYINCYNNVLNILILPLLDSIACCVTSSFSIAELSLN